jgi:predicted transcriptional regulator
MTSFINQNLVEEKSVLNNNGSGEKRYFITEKGKNYLRLLNSMETLISY